MDDSQHPPGGAAPASRAASEGASAAASGTPASDWAMAGLAEAMAAAATDMFLVLDADLSLRFANDAATEVFGDEGCLPGTPLFGHCARLHDDLFFKRIADAVRMQGAWDGEVWFRRADGGVFPAWVRLRGVDAAIGGRTVLAMAHDLARSRDDIVSASAAYQSDALTGLHNRAAMRDLLFQTMAEASALGERCAVILVDLDDFRSVNDDLGHGLGDRILVDRAHRLKAALRDKDAIGRTGGDQFTVLVPRFPSLSEVERVVRRLLQAVADPFTPPGRAEPVSLTACAGIAVYPQDGNTAAGIEQAAEAAFLRAKERGRGRFSFYADEADTGAPARETLETRLRRALDADDFVLHYQPKVALKTGRITGAEALVRWNDPDRGLIEPSDFIPVAEETGLIAPLGLWTIETACREAKRLIDLGLDPGRMAVNVSARQVSDARIVDGVFDILRRTGLPATALELEITESALLERADEAASGLRALRDAGVQITADDFGTGYASLSYLLAFPVDAIKIDRTFVAEIGGSGEGANLAVGVVALAQSLNKRVVAEGVETPRQMAVLRQQMCDEMQGDHFSPPVPADAFEALLRANRDA
jgi:diguanylate cyclase (GGDEF)-like protein